MTCGVVGMTDRQLGDTREAMRMVIPDERWVKEMRWISGSRVSVRAVGSQRESVMMAEQETTGNQRPRKDNTDVLTEPSSPRTADEAEV